VTLLHCPAQFAKGKPVATLPLPAAGTGYIASMFASHHADDAAVVETNLPLPGLRRGKVRDVYDLPPLADGQAPGLLIVATDRVSAFDVVLPTPIPGKGRMLTDISTRWLRWIETQGLARSHLISTESSAIPFLNRSQRASVNGRATIATRCSVVPIECVARGYLAGSGWAEYQRSGSVCSVPLPSGLEQASRLPEPIFTPATKAEQGEHDENISFGRACAIAGEPIMTRLRNLTLHIYAAAHERTKGRGLFLADTKFEFGVPVPASIASDADAARDYWKQASPDDIMIVDEALTPDSSRYWSADAWSPGVSQAPFDKQFVRNYLLGLVREGAWDKTPPGPALPSDVVEQTMTRYAAARERLFGD